MASRFVDVFEGGLTFPLADQHPSRPGRGRRSLIASSSAGGAASTRALRPGSTYRVEVDVVDPAVAPLLELPWVWATWGFSWRTAQPRPRRVGLGAGEVGAGKGPWVHPRRRRRGLVIYGDSGNLPATTAARRTHRRASGCRGPVPSAPEGQRTAHPRTFQDSRPALRPGLVLFEARPAAPASGSGASLGFFLDRRAGRPGRRLPRSRPTTNRRDPPTFLVRGRLTHLADRPHAGHWGARRWVPRCGLDLPCQHGQVDDCGLDQVDPVRRRHPATPRTRHRFGEGRTLFPHVRGFSAWRHARLPPHLRPQPVSAWASASAGVASALRRRSDGLPSVAPPGEARSSGDDRKKRRQPLTLVTAVGPALTSASYEPASATTTFSADRRLRATPRRRGAAGHRRDRSTRHRFGVAHLRPGRGDL